MPPPFRFKVRKYLHFDLPVSRKVAEKLACDADAVRRKAFFPFLGYTVKTRRMRRDEQGKVVVRTKEREIKIAAHRDAAIYSHYSDILGEFYEARLRSLNLQRVVTAFRPAIGGTNVDHAREVFRFIATHRPCVALAIDIEKFFDTLSHDLLLNQWRRVMGLDRLPCDHFALYRNLTQFVWVDREEAFAALGISKHNPKSGGRLTLCSEAEFHEKIRAGRLIRRNPRRGMGVPQGSPISAMLSNIYMLDFDAEMQAEVARFGGLYRRYCDDVMIVVPPEHETEVFQSLSAAVQRAALEVNPDKVGRAEFPGEASLPSDKAIQYLGFTYNGVQTLLRASSLCRYYGKMRAGVALAKQTQRKHNRRELARGVQFSRLKRRKLYLQYSYLISRRNNFGKGDPKEQGNFLTYAYRASEKLNAPEIKRQMKNHWGKLQQAIEFPISNQLSPP